MKKKIPEAKSDEVLANDPAPATEDKVDTNCEYKQKLPASSDIQNQDFKPPDLLIFMRACFILLLTMCTSFNDQKHKSSAFSNLTLPMTRISPAQSPKFTPRFMPCSVTKYEMTHSCPCEQFVCHDEVSQDRRDTVVQVGQG